MAEGDGLENRYTRKGIKGSNPLLSAIALTGNLIRLGLLVFFGVFCLVVIYLPFAPFQDRARQ